MNTVHNYYCTVFNRKLKELSMIFSVFVTISTNILSLSSYRRSGHMPVAFKRAPVAFIVNSRLVWQ